MKAKLTSKEKEHLTMMANKSITRYIVMTIIGCVFLTIGLIMLIIVPFELVPIGAKGNMPPEIIAQLVIAIVLMAGPGAALTDVGIPCWIALGIQIKIARNKLNNLK